jgi:hypothetical protein
MRENHQRKGGPKAALRLLLTFSAACLRFKTGGSTRRETGFPFSDCGQVFWCQNRFCVRRGLFYFRLNDSFAHFDFLQCRVSDGFKIKGRL